LALRAFGHGRLDNVGSIADLIAYVKFRPVEAEVNRNWHFRI
jgi:hypothetical protein